MIRRVVWTVVVVCVSAPCAWHLAAQERQQQRELPKVVRDFIAKQPRPKPLPKHLRTPLEQDLVKHFPLRRTPPKLPPEPRPRPELPDRGDQAWSKFTSLLTQSVLAFMRRPPTVPEEALQLAPLTMRFRLHGESGEDVPDYDKLGYTEVASNIPASQWDWGPVGGLDLIASSLDGTVQAWAYARGQNWDEEEPTYEQFIAKAIVGVQFEAWQSGKLEIVAQFGERHIRTYCGTYYNYSPQAAATVSGYTAVSHYMPPNQDESVYYGHKTDFSHVDSGSFPPGMQIGWEAEVEDEWESAFGGIGAGPLPFVLSPEVVMIQQGELCVVYAGWVTDVYAANHGTYAAGQPLGRIEYIDVTIKPVG
jgi:hypothetical protein